MHPGEVFEDRFRVQHEVGRGSFGIVYRVEDLATGDPRAIKVLYPWAQRDEALRRRLKREARCTQSMRSPHVVRIDDVTETAGGELYMVMEFVEGRELSDVLRDEGPLATDRVAEIGRQILDALAEAHAAGVIHRDLKPHNVFLCRAPDGGDSVKVFDFGIAKLANDSGLQSQDTGKLTVSGGVLGTPVYMSPEQCHGENLTPASDLYSLGVVLYELVSGRPPFDHENPVQIMLMHATAPVPPLPDAVAGAALGRAISRALQKDPAARFASAAEFRDALQPGLASTTAVAVEFADVRPVAETAAAPPAPIAAAPQPADRRPTSPSTAAQRRAAYHRGGAGAFFQRYWLPLLIVALGAVAALSYWL